MSPSHDGELDALESVHHEKFPSSYPQASYLPKLQEGDEFYLGSDDEDDWDDFEDVRYLKFSSCEIIFWQF